MRWLDLTGTTNDTRGEMFRRLDAVLACDWLRFAQSSRSLGTLPPLAAMRASTVLCSQMFILAESPIRSAGQPNSAANSLRAVRLLSMSSSFSRSTMEVRQLSFCGLAAARCSSCATTSTTATGLGADEAVGDALALAGAVPDVGTVVGFSAVSRRSQVSQESCRRMP